VDKQIQQRKLDEHTGRKRGEAKEPRESVNWTKIMTAAIMMTVTTT
jgi:hypothetical protein